MKKLPPEWFFPALAYLFLCILLFLPVFRENSCSISHDEMESISTCVREWLTTFGTIVGAAGTIFVTYLLYRIEKNRQDDENKKETMRYYIRASKLVGRLRSIQGYINNTLLEPDQQSRWDMIFAVSNQLDSIRDQIERVTYKTKSTNQNNNLRSIHKHIENIDYIIFQIKTSITMQEQICFFDEIESLVKEINSRIDLFVDDVKSNSDSYGILGPYSF